MFGNVRRQLCQRFFVRSIFMSRSRSTKSRSSSLQTFHNFEWVVFQPKNAFYLIPQPPVESAENCVSAQTMLVDVIHGLVGGSNMAVEFCIFIASFSLIASYKKGSIFSFRISRLSFWDGTKLSFFLVRDEVLSYKLF